MMAGDPSPGAFAEGRRLSVALRFPTPVPVSQLKLFSLGLLPKPPSRICSATARDVGLRAVAGDGWNRGTNVAAPGPKA